MTWSFTLRKLLRRAATMFALSGLLLSATEAQSGTSKVRLMLRHAWLIGLGVFLALIGILGAVAYFSVEPKPLRAAFDQASTEDAGQQVAIVHPERLTRCLPGEVGEIWVAGSSVAQGYWNRPEQTMATFAGYLADSGEGPFLRTEWDTIWYAGATRDAGGWTAEIAIPFKSLPLEEESDVWGFEVERVIRAVPGVDDVRVVGKRSSLAGELVTCQVVAAPDREESAVHGAIVAACVAELAPFQRPRLIEFVPELVLEASGKLLRRAQP